MLCILDEAMSYAAIFHGAYCVTAKMESRLKSPARVGQPLVATSHLTKKSKRLLEAKARIALKDGTVVAESTGTMFVISKKEPKNA